MPNNKRLKNTISWKRRIISEARLRQEPNGRTERAGETPKEPIESLLEHRGTSTPNEVAT